MEKVTKKDIETLETLEKIKLETEKAYNALREKIIRCAEMVETDDDKVIISVGNNHHVIVQTYYENRFDSKEFRAKHGVMYEQFKRPVKKQRVTPQITKK